MSITELKGQMLTKVKRLGFSPTPEGYLNTYLTARHVIDHRLQPQGPYPKESAYSALNDYKLQNQLRKFIPGLPRWDYFKKAEALEFIEFFKGICVLDIMRLIELQCPDFVNGILRYYCHADFIALLQFYCIFMAQKQNLSYHEFCTLFTWACSALELPDRFNTPFREDHFMEVFHGLSGRALLKGRETPANADGMLQTISEMTGNKEQILQAYLRLLDSSKSNTGQTILAEPYDLLRAMYPKSDAAIEHAMIVGRIFSGKRIDYLLVNPTLEMLKLMHDRMRRFIEELFKKGRRKPVVTVVCEGDIGIDIYDRMFPMFEFETAENFLNKKPDMHYEHVYISALQLKDGRLKELMAYLEGRIDPHKPAYVLLPSKKKAELVEAQCREGSTMHVYRIDKLPTDITESRPLKKNVVTLMFGGNVKQEIQLFSLSIEHRNRDRFLMYCGQKSIPLQEWLSKKSIAVLEAKDYNSEQTTKYEKGILFKYSPEITIKYRFNPHGKDPHRVFFSILFEKSGSALIADKQANRNKRFQCSEESFPSEIAKFITTEYLFFPKSLVSIRQHISLYPDQNSTIGLRAFWLCLHGEEHNTSTKPIPMAMDALVNDDRIGNLIIGKTT